MKAMQFELPAALVVAAVLSAAPSAWVAVAMLFGAVALATVAVAVACRGKDFGWW